MKWLEQAWLAEGVAEIAGPEENLDILQYFADVGRSDVRSEVTPWCAAFAGACLVRAGVKIDAVPTHERLLARSYAKIGSKIDEPRPGCLVILKRGDNPLAGHVGFCVGSTATSVAVLGGNQSNAVNVQHFPRDSVIAYRWPSGNLPTVAVNSKTILGQVLNVLGIIVYWMSEIIQIAVAGAGEVTNFEPLRALAPHSDKMSYVLVAMGIVITVAARLNDAKTGKNSG